MAALDSALIARGAGHIWRNKHPSRGHLVKCVDAPAVCGFDLAATTERVEFPPITKPVMSIVPRASHRCSGASQFLQVVHGSFLGTAGVAKVYKPSSAADSNIYHAANLHEIVRNLGIAKRAQIPVKSASIR